MDLEKQTIVFFATTLFLKIKSCISVKESVRYHKPILLQQRSLPCQSFIICDAFFPVLPVMLPLLGLSNFEFILLQLYFLKKNNFEGILVRYLANRERSILSSSFAPKFYYPIDFILFFLQQVIIPVKIFMICSDICVVQLV